MATNSPVERLVAELGFQVDDKQLNNFQSKLTNVAKTLRRIGAVASGASVALGALTNKTASQNFELSKLARNLDVNFNELKVYSNAFDIAGESSDAFKNSLVELEDVISAVNLRGGKGFETQATQIKRLGLSVKNQNGELKNSLDLFLEIAEAVEKIQNTDLQKEILAGLNIPRELADFIRFEGVAELERFVELSRQATPFITDDDLERQKQATENFRLLKLNLNALRESLSNIFTGVFADAVGRLNDLTVTLSDFFKTNEQAFREFVESVREIFGILIDTIVFAINTITTATNFVKGLLNNQTPELSDPKVRGFVKNIVGEENVETAIENRVIIPATTSQFLPNLTFGNIFRKLIGREIKTPNPQSLLSQPSITNNSATNSSVNQTNNNTINLNIETSDLNDTLEQAERIKNRIAERNLQTVIAR